MPTGLRYSEFKRKAAENEEKLRKWYSKYEEEKKRANQLVFEIECSKKTNHHLEEELKKAVVERALKYIDYDKVIAQLERKKGEVMKIKRQLEENNKEIQELRNFKAMETKKRKHHTIAETTTMELNHEEKKRKYHTIVEATTMELNHESKVEEKKRKYHTIAEAATM